MTTEELQVLVDGQQKQIAEISSILATIAKQLTEHSDQIAKNAQLSRKITEVLKYNQEIEELWER